MDGALTFASGTVALVTGAASGIGLAAQRRLAAEGVREFVLVDRDEGLAGIAGSEVTARTHVGDVSEERLWDRVEPDVREWRAGLDVCVVAAGVAGAAAIPDLDFAEWRRILAANLDGVFLTLRTAMRLMRPGGAVVIVASASGLKAEPGIAAYAASKAGAIQLGRVAAKEGASRGIRVNIIAPGGVETPIWRGVPMFDELVAKTGSERAAFDELASFGTPLGRYARPEEIAAQIVFLLSPAAATITGAVLTSDGGYTL